MKKVKLIFERKTCIGAFTCMAVSEEIWGMDENKEDKAKIILPNVKEKDGVYEVIVEGEELVEKAISSAEVCPVYAIRIVDAETGDKIF